MTISPKDIDLRSAIPAEIRQRQLPRADMVTSVIEHDVKPGAEAEYEAWLKRISPIAERFPGHRGISFVGPAGGSGKYMLVLRFDTLEHAQDWFQSAARRALMAEVQRILTNVENIEMKTGLEFWFRHPAARKQPSRFKQSLVTLVVLYPLTLMIPPMVGRLTMASPDLGSLLFTNLIVDAIIVGLLSYVLMPTVTRCPSRWLFA